VNDFNPQLFIWLGDNIYADKKRPFRFIGKERTIGPWKNSQRFFPSSIREMEEKYAEAKRKPGYVKLRKHARVLLLFQ
jgi:alkaline phosphatase D